MTLLLLAAQWLHLALCVLLTGAFSLLLLAGPPQTHSMRQWERRVLRWTRSFVIGALVSGFAVLAARTGQFEGRSEAAFEPQAIWRAMLDTRPGFVWMTRQGLLVVVVAFLFLGGGDVTGQANWIAARAEALLLSAAALALIGGSSHMAAISESGWTQAIDMAHLLAAGIWVGGLPPLALLLYEAGRRGPIPDPAAVRAMQRFSRVALLMVVLLVGSGLASAWALIGGVAGLVGTTHGQLLLAKLALLLPALLLAAVNRAALPALASPAPTTASSTARHMALLIAAEAGLVLALLGFAAAMTVSTPAVHGDPAWPWSFRISLDALPAVPLTQASIASLLTVAVVAIVAIALLLRRQPILLAAMLVGLVASSVAIGLQPSVVRAYPTSFLRPPVSYDVDSIAQGMAVYEEHCGSCHGTPNPNRPPSGRNDVGILASITAQQAAGDLFWLITHGAPDRGMPEFGTRLPEAERWRVINFLHALGMARVCASENSRIGGAVEPDHAWLPAPDLAISVGPLAPTALRDFRGKRMVLLVLYALPGSRERMSELAKRYGALSVLGVEIVAVPDHASPEAIADLGQSPRVLFPVVTDGNEDIAAAYRLFAPGAGHAEFLVDRQGYIRAIWRGDEGAMPDADFVQAQVEALNAEKSPPPLPDDHIH